jgi:hypothetical protein
MQYNMLTIIKTFSILLNKRESHFKKRMWDWCLWIGPFILVGLWHNLTTHLVFVTYFQIHAFSSSSEFKTFILSPYFYYDSVCALPIYSVLWSLIGPITTFKNLETRFEIVTQPST